MLMRAIPARRNSSTLFTKVAPLVLSFEEIERLARIVVEHYGVDGIRLTGGEPTMRAHLPVLVSKLAALVVPADSASPLAGQPIDLAITTNGATLVNCVDELRLAGIARINISLDTLDRKKFETMTRRDELARVLAGIEAARHAGFSSVKINAVIERGVNDDEILDLAEFGRDTSKTQLIDTIHQGCTIGRDCKINRLACQWRGRIGGYDEGRQLAH